MKNAVISRTNNLCNFHNNHELLTNSDKNASNHKSSAKTMKYCLNISLEY